MVTGHKGQAERDPERWDEIFRSSLFQMCWFAPPLLLKPDTSRQPSLLVIGMWVDCLCLCEEKSSYGRVGLTFIISQALLLLSHPVRGDPPMAKTPQLLPRHIRWRFALAPSVQYPRAGRSLYGRTAVQIMSVGSRRMLELLKRRRCTEML